MMAGRFPVMSTLSIPSPLIHAFAETLRHSLPPPLSGRVGVESMSASPPTPTLPHKGGGRADGTSERTCATRPEVQDRPRRLVDAGHPMVRVPGGRQQPLGLVPIVDQNG